MFTRDALWHRRGKTEAFYGLVYSPKNIHGGIETDRLVKRRLLNVLAVINTILIKNRKGVRNYIIGFRIFRGRVVRKDLSFASVIQSIRAHLTLLRPTVSE